MTMVRMLIQVPKPLKAKLDALQGTTSSGYIRAWLERELNHAPRGRKGR
jgi:hypothetical protein